MGDAFSSMYCCHGTSSSQSSPVPPISPMVTGSGWVAGVLAWVSESTSDVVNAASAMM